MLEVPNRFAAKLIELGFEKFSKKPGPDEILNCELIEFDDIPESTERKKVLPTLSPGEPYFMTIATGVDVPLKFAATIAGDDTGQVWVLRGKAIDLRPYGFIAALERALPN